jgi:hypothetical protein
LLFACAASSARAAVLGEVPPLRGSGGTTCAGPAGTPGEVTVPTDAGVRFYVATRAGFQRGQEVKLGERFSCRSVQTRPGGAGLIVGESGSGLVAVVRDPGGPWSDPIDLSGTGSALITNVSAAVSDRGDAVVGFTETQISERGSGKSQVFVARRVPGAAGFIPSDRLGAAAKSAGGIEVGVSATGEAVALTSSLVGRRLPLAVAIAPAGESFTAPVAIGTSQWLGSPVLEVAPDGRALVTFLDGTAVRVAERAPGASFGPAVPVGASDASILAGVTAKLGADGAAAIAWRSPLREGVRLVTRPAPGAFSAPVEIESHFALLRGYDPFYLSESYFTELLRDIDEGFFQLDPSDFEGLALTPDGRVALADSSSDSLFAATAQLTTVPLAGGGPPPGGGRPGV